MSEEKDAYQAGYAAGYRAASKGMCPVPWSFLDRLNDVCVEDPLNKIFSDLVEHMTLESEA